MKLDKLVLVNWGQLRPGNFEAGDMTLLTGETGSGKTTMLDALQTVMTGANKSILIYNAGQDEVTQGQKRGKTKRTLESYIVGGEYSNFSRPNGAQGFMAAVFRPSKGEDGLKPFTALVAASARVEGNADSRQARLESLALVIVDDAALTFEDFMKDAESGECIEVERLVRHLQAKYPRVQNFNDHKMDYLCALYGRFRGRNSVTRDEATNAAKAWVQSIAFKPIGSVHELVRDEILDFDEKQLQQDIERISGLMRQVSNLRQESIRLQQNVVRLDGLQTALKSASGAYEALVLQDMFVAKLAKKKDEETIAEKQEQIEKDKSAAEQIALDIRGWKERAKVLDGQRIDLTARLQGIPAHSKKQELEASLARATSEAKATLNSLYGSLMAAALLEQRATELISRPIPAEFKKLTAAVTRVSDALRDTDFSRMAACRDAVVEATTAAQLNVEKLYALVHAFQGMNQGVAALIDALIGPNESVSLAVVAESTTLVQQKGEADRLVKELAGKKERLSRGKVSYPRSTEVAISLLQEQFPEANAQVLIHQPN